MAECRVESELTKRLNELIKAIRNDSASVDECLEFMKAMNGSSRSGESFNMSDSLNALRSLRDELPLEKAVHFLKNYLNSLPKKFSHKNWLYVVEIGFLIAEDLAEVSNNSGAEEEYKEILEWLSKHNCDPAEALATSKLAILAWQAAGSNPEAERYHKKCSDILKSIMSKKRSFTLTPYLEMKYVTEAFVECGRFCRLAMENHDSAEDLFLKALKYIPKEDEIFYKYVVYSQLYQNEYWAKNFQTSARLLPWLHDVWDAVSGTGKDAIYLSKATEFGNLFIQSGNFAKNMKTFLRHLKANDICQMTSPRYRVPDFDDYTLSMLMRCIVLLEAGKADTTHAHQLALLSLILFEKGKSDFRDFKVHAKKFIDYCMSVLETKSQCHFRFEYVVPLMRSTLVMFALCLQDKCYEEAEEYAVKASTLAFKYPLGPLDANMKAELFFLSACLNYFRRGRVSVVKDRCLLALKHYRKVDFWRSEWPLLIDKQAIESLMKSLILE